MIHKTEVENYRGSTKQLVEDIGNLRYDALAEFLELLSNKIHADGEKDLSRKRYQLATALFECVEKLKESKTAAEKAWKTCEPYMS